MESAFRSWFYIILALTLAYFLTKAVSATMDRSPTWLAVTTLAVGLFSVPKIAKWIISIKSRP
jgi:hypothetical protein